MWIRMWLLHSMARMISKMDEPSLDQELASLKCPNKTLSLPELKDCYTMIMTSSGTGKHLGYVVTIWRFADRFPLSKQDWNVLYAEIVNRRNTDVPALLPLTVMYFYFYVRYLCKSSKNKTRVGCFSYIMPCVGRGSLPTVSLRGLFKRIRCHVACCQGVVTVIEATDGPQEERDMEDGETSGTHSAKNVSQSRPFC